MVLIWPYTVELFCDRWQAASVPTVGLVGLVGLAGGGLAFEDSFMGLISLNSLSLLEKS